MFLRYSPTLEVYRLVGDQDIQAILISHLTHFPHFLIPSFSQHLLKLCRFYQFDPLFILSVIDVESQFNRKAISSAGAVGLMQITPLTAFFIIKNILFREKFDKKERKKNLAHFSKIYPDSNAASFTELLKNPFMNTTLGIVYLSWLRDHYQGITPYVLAAYNIGPTKMDRFLLKKAFQPIHTRNYFLSVRRKIPFYRFYFKNSFINRWKEI
jgi:hypothetical protein